MTAIQTSAEPLPLDLATFNTMLGTTVDALPYPPGATAEERAEKRHAAWIAIAALRPRDPLEAMAAARIVAQHFHAMHNLACSSQPGIPADLQLRCQGRAMALGKHADKMQVDYLKRQMVEPARRPAGLPTSAVVAPDPQGQPQPQPQPQTAPQARVDSTATQPTAEAAPQPAPAARPAADAPTVAPTVAPPARPQTETVAAPRSGDTVCLDEAALQQRDAEADADPQAAALARAA